MRRGVIHSPDGCPQAQLLLGDESSFERGDPGFEPLVFIARSNCHRADGFEFLAADEVHAADEFLGTLAHRGLGLAAGAAATFHTAARRCRSL